MRFEIQWTGHHGAAIAHRLSKGFSDVVIVDLNEDGKAYAPAELAKITKR
jgi:hypothetical protein